ncbi:peptidoglycan-binding protein [Terrabacter sp. NPDC000476]|uniref:peptidoglycan-binding protein n=1 Tax=Terrabacter sp. NPDC000476 TaxID=3154258 RepID=UPI0033170784
MCELHETATPAVGRRTLLRGAGGLLLGGGLVAATSSAAQAATSQNGWPAGSSSTVPLATLSVGAATFPAGVRRGDVHVVLGYVARRFDDEVEALVKGWCWGHSYRPISGSTTLSNHSSGTAIDLNAPRHPLGRSGTFTATQRSHIRAILTSCNGVVRWGGDYSGRKDEMHFEINVRPGDARLAALAKRIGGGGGTPTPTPIAWTTVKRGASGFRVTAIQHLLRARGQSLTVDGSFGPTTQGKVVAFQRSRGLAADGVVGPKTWSALVVTVRRGSTGQAVVAAQKLLTHRGYTLTADGAFGAVTTSKTQAFQRSRGLTADGVVGPRTWAKLTA